MTAIDTVRFEGGLYAAIHHDPDVEQPFAEDDAVRIVILHRRYSDPAGGACGRDPDEVATWAQENAAEWFTIPLFLYDHSGVAYAVGHSNPFHCPWDSGRVGIIALRRADWGSGHKSNDTLAAHAQSVADTYTAWANGDCYGYVLYSRTGVELDACWGIIGRDAVCREATAAAASVPDSVARTWDLCCPACGACDEIDIAATVWVRLCPDGTDAQLAANGDHEWSEHSGAVCQACGYGGNVSDFEIGPPS